MLNGLRGSWRHALDAKEDEPYNRYMDTHSVTTSTLITGGMKGLVGYSFKATADAEIIIRDGDNSSGTGVVYIYLLAGQSVRDQFNPAVSFRHGMYVHVVSGTVAGSVWTN
jgi:hypothetical protein